MCESGLGAVKRAVDADPRPGRFLLTGSVRADLDAQTWPGTGHLVRVPVHRQSERELAGGWAGELFLDLAQLQAEAPCCLSRPRLHHLPQADGRHEIDVVAELGGGRVLALEVKASAAPRAADARHLRWLREHVDDRFVAGVVLHTGPSAFELDERIAALPISTMWA